jgi:hypothetical protein
VSGERHPGRPEYGALRGAPKERGPRSVRCRPSGFLPCGRAHRRQRMSLGRRGGERRRHAHSKSTCTRRKRGAHDLRSGMTRPSLGPRTRARQSPLNFPGASRRRWRVRVSIAVGQTCASRRNRHRGFRERASRGSPHVTASARERRGVLKKRMEVEASLPARIVSSGLVARTSKCSLQKSVGSVWFQISSAYAPQKGRPGSSEREPSSGWASA